MCITRDNLSHQVNTENKRQTYIIGLEQLGHSKEGFGRFRDTKVLPLVVQKEGRKSPIITTSFGPDVHVCIDVYFLSLTWFMRYRILVRIWAHFRGFMGVSLNTRAWKQSTDKDWHWHPLANIVLLVPTTHCEWGMARYLMTSDQISFNSS